ncbi:MAG: tRNA pseudouridine(38-40) synthase TruA [Prolixibacteraceae bacterium]
MPRYFIQMAYNGANYHGWQVQPNAVSVQAELEKALTVVLRLPIAVVGAGRTDTGVHASFFVAHFEMPHPIEDLKHLTYKLNSFLSNAIRIDLIFEVASDLHARFSASSRTYRYFISTRKEPFREATVAYVPYDLDVDMMNEAAQALLSTIDFTSFSKLHTDVKTNNCKVSVARWYRHDGLLVFEIKADRFLRNMVRAIVGTLMDVGREKITKEEFFKIIELHDRGLAGASAYAKALFLTDISYPEPYNSSFIRYPIV